MLHLKRNALGQGMTEYILIVLFVGIAAIAAFESFGGVSRQQAANLSTELAGGTSSPISLPEKPWPTSSSTSSSSALNNNTNYYSDDGATPPQGAAGGTPTSNENPSSNTLEESLGLETNGLGAASCASEISPSGAPLGNTTANPVRVVTGNKIYRAVDYVSQGAFLSLIHI